MGISQNVAVVLRAVPGFRGCVAQISNLLCRRLPVGRLCLLGRLCGLEIRDTADWKSALQTACEICGLGCRGKCMGAHLCRKMANSTKVATKVATKFSTRRVLWDRLEPSY